MYALHGPSETGLFMIPQRPGHPPVQTPEPPRDRVAIPFTADAAYWDLLIADPPAATRDADPPAATLDADALQRLFACSAGAQPCDMTKAAAYVMFVDSMRDMVMFAMHGAAQLGYGQWMMDYVAALDVPRGQTAARDLLRNMMMAGVPLLIATGPASRVADRELVRQMKSVFDACASGSPLLVVDGDKNIVAMVRPMSTGPVYAIEDIDNPHIPLDNIPAEVRGLVNSTGLIPAGLRDTENLHRSFIQLYVDIVGVGPFPELACSGKKKGWFMKHPPPPPEEEEGEEAAARWKAAAARCLRFNYAGDTANPPRPGTKDLVTQGANLYLNRRQCVTKLLGSLSTLGGFLGDFEFKLSQHNGVDRETAELKDKDNPQNHYVFWRRALMIKIMVEHDVTGTMAHSLAGMFPASILGDSPPHPAVPKMAAVFYPSRLGTWADVLTPDQVVALTANVMGPSRAPS